jgi:hypothetical protein
MHRQLSEKQLLPTENVAQTALFVGGFCHH